MMIFGIFVIVAVLAAASAKKKGDDSLLSVLSKERQELKDVFRHENNELREQDTKLRREDDQLRKRVEELQQQNVKMREEKFQDEIARMKKENKRLQKENEKLRHVDRRQRDRIDSLAFEKKKKEVIRQEDVALETKKREAQANDTSRMSDAFSEVQITGGSASATSVYHNNYKPDKAFIRGNDVTGWLSNNDAKNGGIFPQMVWYDFGQGNAFVPARVSFLGQMNCQKGCQKRTPTVWEFVGSNDDVCSGSGNWTTLCQDLSDVLQRNKFDTKFCVVNYSNLSMQQREYRCLGINVIRARDYDYGWTCLSNARMWKSVIQTGGMKNATQLE